MKINSVSVCCFSCWALPYWNWSFNFQEEKGKKKKKMKVESISWKAVVVPFVELYLYNSPISRRSDSLWSVSLSFFCALSLSHFMFLNLLIDRKPILLHPEAFLFGSDRGVPWVWPSGPCLLFAGSPSPFTLADLE